LELARVRAAIGVVEAVAVLGIVGTSVFGVGNAFAVDVDDGVVVVVIGDDLLFRVVTIRICGLVFFLGNRLGCQGR
jgi:hypothetical protein